MGEIKEQGAENNNFSKRGAEQQEAPGSSPKKLKLGASFSSNVDNKNTSVKNKNTTKINGDDNTSNRPTVSGEQMVREGKAIEERTNRSPGEEFGNLAPQVGGRGGPSKTRQAAK